MIEVVVSNVGKVFDGHAVLHDVSFALEPGAVTALVGANGAGKSTLMKLMLGVAQGGGRTTFSGRAYRDLREPARVVGASLDGQSLDPTRTAARHLESVAAATTAPRTRIPEVLETLGLSRVATKRIGTFSLGMRQRLSLAAALLPDPQVLILDEPGNGMDPAGLRWLGQLLRERAAAGVTVLLSSHLLNDVEECATRLLVIDAGRLLADTSLAALIGPHPAQVIVGCDDPMRLIDALDTSARVVEVTDHHLRVDGATVHQIAEKAVRCGVRLHSLRPVQATLHDAYFALIHDGARVAPEPSEELHERLHA